jgi:uncharacterized membrane protein YkoI
MTYVHRTLILLGALASAAVPDTLCAQGGAAGARASDAQYERGSAPEDEPEHERAEHEGRAKARHAAKFALADARARALAAIPGRVIEEELAHERGHWVYSFAIQPAHENSPVTEVNIDADSGQVVSVEADAD